MQIKKLIILLLFCLFAFSACHKPNTIILFNKSPITKDNFLNNTVEFTVGSRIYYLFISEKPLKTEYIRVRILKRDSKANMQAIKMFYSNDFRLNKDQVYYYNDYIVMNESGTYCMAIYALNALDKPLAVADFKVK